MAPSSSIIDRIESIPTRELYFFALYRVLVAALLSALVFGPLTPMVGEAHQPQLAQAVSIAYLLVSIGLLIWGRNERWLQRIVIGSVVVDIAAATHVTPETAKSRLRYARSKLRQALGADEATAAFTPGADDAAPQQVPA